MNNKLQWTSSESQCVRVASYVYISTEMSTMPCKIILAVVKNEKRKEIEASAWTLPKIDPPNIYIGGPSHNFCNGSSRS
jgi:hypothetical protein